MWDVIGCVFGGIGCVISVSIAIRQHKQLKQLTAIGTDTQKIEIDTHKIATDTQKIEIDTQKIGTDTQKIVTDTQKIVIDTQKIGTDTRDTAVKINADSHKREVVRKFFPLESATSKIRCLFPCRYNTDKPLPSIEAGDFYALSVLQDLLGHERLDLGFQIPGDGVGNDLQQGDAIFLCTPTSNPGLAMLAPSLILPFSGGPKCEGVELPCWFANDMSSGSLVKKIWIGNDEDFLESPSEDAYRKCALTLGPCVPKPGIDFQKDYAILLRLSTHRKVFVLAGIHQYGTWIAGECLRRLAIEKDTSIRPSVKALLLGDNDVLAVLWGKFCLSKLTVPELGILDNYIWVRANEVWERRLDLN